MSRYEATISWKLGDQSFLDDAYSRGHEWIFDGGLRVPASASPDIVPLPKSVAENVDPEEAFVASLSSCHMLFFLSIAAKRQYIVDEYVDSAIGMMNKDVNGLEWMTRVTLRPQIKFSGENQPGFASLENMHHLAHERCFIANSVKTEVVIEILADFNNHSSALSK